MYIYIYIYVYVYIYIYIYILKNTCMNTYQPFAAVSRLPAALRRFLKNDVPGFFEHAYCQFSRFSWIWAPLFCFSKSGQSGQMTMPARRASKFSAKRSGVLLLSIFQSLISWVIPENMEPWPECQPEESQAAQLQLVPGFPVSRLLWVPGYNLAPDFLVTISR